MTRNSWNFRWVPYVAALMAATFFFTGCSFFGFSRKGRVDGISSPAALELLSSLRVINGSLSTFKGLGTISLYQNGQIQRFRSAWAASGPDKIRIQLFGPTGQPIISIACDGRYYYFMSPEKEGIIKQRVGAMGLKRYIEIPIGTAELFSFFCGRPIVPGPDPPIANIEKDPLHGTVLVLLESSGEWVDSIYLDSRAQSIREIVRRDDQGVLQWRALFEDVMKLDNYQIPQRITLYAENEVSIRIEVDRFWANPSISKDMFVLNDP